MRRVCRAYGIGPPVANSLLCGRPHGRERDATKPGIANPFNETAGDIDSRGSHRQFEDLSSSDNVPFEYMSLNNEDVAIIEIDDARFVLVEGIEDGESE
jgi:hypothetical protein